VLDPHDLDYLRGISVFAGLTEEILARIGGYARCIETEGDQVLLEQGVPAKEMLVVIEGRLAVIRRNAVGAEACLAVLGPGSLAGEMSLIDIQPRSAEVRSMGRAKVAVLSHGDIASIYREDLKSYTLLVLNIAREISLRLRRLDDLLATMMFAIGDATYTSGDEPHTLPHVGKLP
jgi:CRP-like cAMP-binding protein